MDIYKINEIVITVKNQPGVLKSISDVLAKKGININGIVAYEYNNHALFRIITSDSVTTKKQLSMNKYVINMKENPLIVVKLINKPGELAKLTDYIYKFNVNLNVLYTLSDEDDFKYVALSSSNRSIDELKDILSGV